MAAPPHRKPHVEMPKHLPPLLALRAFEAVARHLSFSKAAQELCVSQSAVSPVSYTHLTLPTKA